MGVHPAEIEENSLTIEFVDRELVNLDRETETFHVWRFLLHLIDRNCPGGLIFLCGDDLHRPDYFARRLNENGGVDVLEFFKVFENFEPSEPILWTTRASASLVEQKYGRFLEKTVRECVRDGINGIPQDAQGGLADVYARVDRSMGRRVFLFPLVVDAKNSIPKMSAPPKKIVKEFDEFVSNAKANTARSDDNPIFLFCVIVRSTSCGLIRVSTENDDLGEGRFHDHALTVSNREDYPVEDKLHYWGISEWEGVRLGQVVDFIDVLKRKTRHEDLDRIQVLINDVYAKFEGISEVPLGQTRSMLDQAIADRSEKG